jgi:hypothetical protein
MLAAADYRVLRNLAVAKDEIQNNESNLTPMPGILTTFVLKEVW